MKFTQNDKKIEVDVDFDVHPRRIINGIVIGEVAKTVIVTAVKKDIGLGGRIAVAAAGVGITHVANAVMDKFTKERTDDKKVKAHITIFNNGVEVKMKELEKEGND